MLRDISVKPLSGNAPKQIILFVEGYGGVIEIGWFMPTVVKWQVLLPDCEFICAAAPWNMDESDGPELRTPEECRRRKWFNLDLGNPDAMLMGANITAPIFNTYIDQLLAARNLKPENIAIIGFSQGAMMLLHSIPRRTSPLACVVAYCGLLIKGDLLLKEKKSDTPVLLIHGTSDEIVPYAAMASAASHLQCAGIPVKTTKLEGERHGPSDKGATIAFHFMRQHLLKVDEKATLANFNFDFAKLRELCKAVNAALLPEDKKSETLTFTSTQETETRHALPDTITDHTVSYYTFEKLGVFEEDIDFIERTLMNTIYSGMDKEKMRAAINLYSMLKIRLTNLLDLERHKKFNFISLGNGCLPRNIMTRWGIKKSRIYGEPSNPFDLALHSLPTIIECLETNFRDYLDDQYLQIDAKDKCPSHARMHIRWYHENEATWSKNNFENLKKRYRRRIENFHAMLAEEKHMFCFLNYEDLYTPIVGEQVYRIFAALQKLTSQPITLFFANTTYRADHDQFPVEEIFHEINGRNALYAYDVAKPKPNYSRWAYQDFSTSEGVRFEKNILDALMEALHERSNVPISKVA